MPIISSSDHSETDKGMMSHLARGVILLINKNDPLGFSDDDIAKLELYAQVLGRCHYVIEKIEQFYSLYLRPDRI